MKDSKAYSTRFIGVLDGIRAMSVIIVMIFHFWQQTWIFPVVQTPFLKFIGLTRIDFTPFAKVGYLFVDMMILISGMLLFLPVARNMLLGEPLEKWRTFYKKRAIRILPSYLFCILLLFVYELSMGGYGTPADLKAAFTDLISHLLFLHTWKVQTYLATRLNVVLWTLAVEVWFYVLFPLLASFVKRWKKEKTAVRPLIRGGVLAAVLIGLSLIYIYCYALNSGSPFAASVDLFLNKLGSGIRSSYPAMVINQLPAFFGTYAVGFIGAVIYVAAASKLKPHPAIGAVATVLSVGFIWLMVQMIKACAKCDAPSAQIWQITERLPLALCFMGVILTTAFAAKWYRFLFSNPLMHFLSLISYNLYIWHQWLCVQLKTVWRIPAWTGDDPPNMWSGPDYTPAQQAFGLKWRSEYALVITLFAFGAAILVTFLLERPASDLLNGRSSIYNGKLKTLFRKKEKQQ